MKRQTPRLPAQLLEATTLDPEDSLVSGLRLRKCKDIGISGLDVRGCVLERCSFSGSRILNAAFTDVVFLGCDLSNVDCTGSSFVRCVFEDCKAVGLRAIDAYFHHVLLQGGAYTYANFDGAALMEFEMHGAWMPNANFGNCKLEGFAPHNAVLTGVNFFGTALAGIDFREAEIDGLTCAGRELVGAVVTSVQAAGLAKLFGINVRD